MERARGYEGANLEAGGGIREAEGLSERHREPARGHGHIPAPPAHLHEARDNKQTNKKKRRFASRAGGWASSGKAVS